MSLTARARASEEARNVLWEPDLPAVAALHVGLTVYDVNRLPAMETEVAAKLLAHFPGSQPTPRYLPKQPADGCYKPPEVGDQGPVTRCATTVD